MNRIADKILTRIRSKGRGFGFSSKSFLDFGSRASVDKALSTLAQEGTVRRLCRGVYDYARFNVDLGGDLEPQYLMTLPRYCGLHVVAERRDAQPAILNENDAGGGIDVRHATPCRHPGDLTAPLLSADGAGGEGDGRNVRNRVKWRANLRIAPLVHRETLSGVPAP